MLRARLLVPRTPEEASVMAREEALVFPSKRKIVALLDDVLLKDGAAMKRLLSGWIPDVRA